VVSSQSTKHKLPYVSFKAEARGPETLWCQCVTPMKALIK